MSDQQQLEQRFPLRLTVAQRKAIAELFPEFSARLKLDEANQRLVAFSLAEMSAILETCASRRRSRGFGNDAKLVEARHRSCRAGDRELSGALAESRSRSESTSSGSRSSTSSRRSGGEFRRAIARSTSSTNRSRTPWAGPTRTCMIFGSTTCSTAILTSWSETSTNRFIRDSRRHDLSQVLPRSGAAVSVSNTTTTSETVGCTTSSSRVA